MKRRVVITGLGAVTPIGNTVEEFWNGVRKGACGIGTITKFDTQNIKYIWQARSKASWQKNAWISRRQDEWELSPSMPCGSKRSVCRCRHFHGE